MVQGFTFPPTSGARKQNKFSVLFCQVCKFCSVSHKYTSSIFVNKSTMSNVAIDIDDVVASMVDDDGDHVYGQRG